MINMNSKVNKSCAVSQCDNTSKKTPGKLFVYVPHNKTMRHKWLNLARRNPADIGLNTPIYFCEDHFDLPNDMENYFEYHVMGSVSQVRMRPGCVPTKFECKLDKRKQKSKTTRGKYILKNKRKLLIEQCEKDLNRRNAIAQNLELGKTLSEPAQTQVPLMAGVTSCTQHSSMEPPAEASRGAHCLVQLKEEVADDPGGTYGCEDMEAVTVKEEWCDISLQLDGGVSEQDSDVREQDGGVSEQDGDTSEQDGGVSEQDGDTSGQDGSIVIPIKTELTLSEGLAQLHTHQFSELGDFSYELEVEWEPDAKASVTADGALTYESPLPKMSLQNQHRPPTKQKEMHRCKVCEKHFKYKSVLMTHMRVHTGEKPFTCNQCQKKFTNKRSLTSHMAIHTIRTSRFSRVFLLLG